MTDIPCQPDTNRGRSTALALRNGMVEEVVRDFCASEEVAVELSSSAEEETSDLPSIISQIIDRRFATKQIEEETYKSYGYSLKHIARGFSGIAPGEVTPALVRAWIEDSIESGVSLDVLNRARVLMSSSFRTLISDGYPGVLSNPIDSVPKLKVPQRPQNPLSQKAIAELNRRLVCMHDCFLLRAIVLALHTGMRRGEACAITYRDIDLGEDRVRIAYSMYESRSGALVKKDTKGHECRWAPLNGFLSNFLSNCYEADVAALCSMGFSKSDAEARILNWHVVSADCGKPMKPKRITEEWKVFVTDSGILGVDGQPPRFHDLRHTFATQWIAAGNDVKALSFILGHKDVRTTMDIYVSVDDTSMRIGMYNSSRTLSAGWLGAERLDGRTHERLSNASQPILLSGDALTQAVTLSSRFGISIPDAVYKALELVSREVLQVPTGSEARERAVAPACP